MPIQLFKSIRAMRRYAIYELIMITITPIFIFLMISAAKHSLQVCFFVSVLVIVMLIAIFAVSKKNLKQRVPSERYYRVKIPAISVEDIKTRLNLEEVSDGAFCTLGEYRKIRFRILVMECDGYDGEKIKSMRKNANSAINKKYKLKNEQTLFDRNMRLNVYLHGNTNELLKLTHTDDRRLLDRVEPIINMYFDLTESVLFVPLVHDALNIKQVRFYESAIRLIAEAIIP